MSRHTVPAVLAAAAILAGASDASAALEVVATTSSLGMLVRAVGGDAVKVTVLAPPDRDVHSLQAKPSMMLAVRRARLLVSVGAELEIGWLPAVLDGARNANVHAGRPGYFEAAAQVALAEAGEAADRGQGDVHPAGNPHLYMDPVRMGQVARALAARLGELDPPHAAAFSQRADAFARAAQARVIEWREKTAGAPGVVFFHKDANYLARLLDVPILGFVEPLPGIPPTAAHLKDLVGRLRGTRGVVLSANFQPSQGPEFLARELGWPKARLPLEPALDASADDYLDLVGQWVDAVASAKR